ncbi:MAG: hypothetical protein JSV91_00390 [Phycisphaerales bacterium]|nr:MAG: hypothetical protein JSV91_00390 [Phycisphaerales bacterium]
MRFRALPTGAAAWGCMFLTFGAIAEPAPPQGSVSVTIPVGGYQVTKTERGDELTIEDFGYLNTPGMPQLPTRIFAVAIPPGAEFVDLQYDPGQGVVLPGTYQVPPATLPRVIGQEDAALYEAELRQCEINRAAVYGSDDAFPRQPVEFVRTAGYRGYNLVDVMVTPFAYYPQSGQLVYYPDVTVNVTYLPSRNEAGAIADDSARIEALAAEIVLNHDQARSWYREDASTDRGLHDFVIITLDSLSASINAIVDWESTKGRTVEVVSTSYINSFYTGYDLAEKMRNFLREKYPADQWGIEDVLLIGHYDDVPMRRTAQNTGYGQPETDFYYAELTKADADSWDADGDHQWGEDSDPIDFYAEVNVGRIPWSQPDIVLSICEKSVAYEQNTDPSFKNNILLLGAFFWPDTDNAVLMEAKVDQSWMADWTMTRMYEQGYTTYPMDYNLNNVNVQSVWSAGKFAFVNWAGHGSPTSSHIYYSTGEAFIANSNCPYLNDDYPAIIFADACSNSDTDYLNIGQAMMEQGGVGFLGATKVAYGMPGWYQPYSGSSQSLDYFFTTYLTSRDYTLGGGHQRALLEMYTHNMWYYLKYETFEWGAIWGNPNLAMGSPAALSISFPDGLPELLAPGVETAITVKITDGLETYVPGTGTLYCRYDGGTYVTSQLTSIGGDLYEAILPPAACDDVPEFYFSAEGDGSTVIYSPYGAPDNVYTADVGVINVAVEDDFQDDLGWTVENFDLDTGAWERVDPVGSNGNRGDPPDDYDGSGKCYVTGDGYDEDIDGGPTVLTSPTIDLSGVPEAEVSYARWFYNDDNDADRLLCEISNDNGASWVTLENVSHDPGWTVVSFFVADYVTPTDQMVFRFSADDNPNDSVTEAGIDAFMITSFDCDNDCPEDVNSDAVVNIDDLFEILGHWGETGGTYDVNADGTVNIDDIFAVLAAWGPCP